ncbi:uncharacterized protein ZBAI_02728 [Zygosaccharomyces bailii ISA1307]|nr:uncharacterized protein ZBAI_02728 [Zygosaccharomyces bailii ISA1307]
MRTSTVLSSVAVALLSNQVLATPPACLLACVAEVTKGSSKCDAMNEVNCICSNESDSVKSCLNSKCPNNNAEEAWSAFQSSCNGKIGSSSSSSASSSSTSSSSKATGSKATSSKATSSKATSSKATSSKAASSKATSSTAAGSSTPSQTGGKAVTSQTNTPSGTAAAAETTSESEAASSEAAGSQGAQSATVQTQVVSSTGDSGVAVYTNYVTQYSTVVEGVTVTETGAPVTKTVEGSTVEVTTTCSTVMAKRDASESASITSTSSGAAAGLQVGPVAFLAGAALLI